VASTRPTPPPPREGNERLITTTITVGWAVALVVLLIVRDSLPSGERWWLWTCVTGVVLGFFGLWYVPHLQRRRAETAAQRAAVRQDSPENDSNTVSSSETPGMSTRS
jgi:Protein of unknown function (DUF2530)